MNNLLSAVWVIARRDYLATVAKRSFLMFLFAPLVLLLFSGGMGYFVGTSAAHEAHPSELVVMGSADTTAAFINQYGTLRDQLGSDGFIQTSVMPLADTSEAAMITKAKALMTDPNRKVRGVLTGLPDHPELISTQAGLDQLKNSVALTLNQVVQSAQLKTKDTAPATIDLAVHPIDSKGVNITDKREGLALGAIYILFLLNILLAGMLLSNMVEEKSSKIIEVLIAAVPVDAVFFGKLISMLAISLTAIAVWVSVVLIGFFGLANYYPGAVALPDPAVGWPLFVVLEILYFMMNYLLYGAIFLGIGAQANTVREVQTMSLPATFAQGIVFAVISMTRAHPHGPLAIGAMIFPLSSPMMMVGAAARDATLWPHLVALCWQALWVTLIVRFASGRFRRIVLKSGPAPSKKAIA